MKFIALGIILVVLVQFYSSCSPQQQIPPTVAKL